MARMSFVTTSIQHCTGFLVHAIKSIQIGKEEIQLSLLTDTIVYIENPKESIIKKKLIDPGHRIQCQHTSVNFYIIEVNIGIQKFFSIRNLKKVCTESVY